MSRRSLTYCAPAHVLKTLHRDGLGWGHDLECGRITVDAPQKRWRRFGLRRTGGQ